MATKNARTDPKANPHLFLKLFRLQICECKPRIAESVLKNIIGIIPDAELKRVARKASNHFLGKKADSAKRDKFRRKCLKNLRAMRTRERQKGVPIPENVCD